MFFYYPKEGLKPIVKKEIWIFFFFLNEFYLLHVFMDADPIKRGTQQFEQLVLLKKKKK
jgi:hypothetical protein